MLRLNALPQSTIIIEIMGEDSHQVISLCSLVVMESTMKWNLPKRIVASIKMGDC